MANKRTRILGSLAGSYLALSALTTSAAGLTDITAAEWAMLPKYCIHTQSYKGHVQPYIARWEAQLGPTFWHMHHYCWALLKYGRYERANASSRQKAYYLEEAHGDFVYVVTNAEKDFVLMPEVLTWLARTEIRLRRFADAEKSLAQARTIKPDYWPAYFHWVEYLQSAGRKAEALALVTVGLQHSPNAKALQAQYRSLGGKPDQSPASDGQELALPSEAASGSTGRTNRPVAPGSAPAGSN